ncbi:MAG: hypothetical protein ABIU77_01070, partial [Ferruginibacter sp.]
MKYFFRNIRQGVALLLLLFINNGIIKAQPLTLAQQQEDFIIFKTSMQQMHAGVYWFITPERFNTLY